MQGIARADGDAVLAGEVRFLQGAGEGHQAVPRRLEAPGRPLADLAARRTSSPSSTADCTAACGCRRTISATGAGA